MSHTKFDYITLGDPHNEPLVFLAGFPDDHLSGWSPLVEELKDRYYVIALCIPQFEKDATYKKWGYTFDELIHMMDNSIEEAVPKEKLPVTLIGHDWGSLFGFLYQNKFPSKIKKYVTVDIGLMTSISLWGMFLMLLYQWWFAIAYIVSQLFGEFIGHVVFGMCVLLLTYVPLLNICPNEKFPRPRNEVNVNMTYVYYQYWKETFCGRSLKPKFPTCPVLFMYGKKKRTMFHDEKFIKQLSETSGCKHVGYDCGHW
eukprot:CAMPEP_0185019726 /NCGR_PEP_ID=MMETSP1103-20130426/2330_1 /TAXON_ID=36769 /ORGANISM="Paraphysomonas bandaiensis, Strain Caron Lab Isolate" /LENGTH=255 /DNA_ID=CAMNT_0027550189 /DNA_START=118 /DNA_END=882 /DNA_ORIENTATION=-